MYHTFETRIRLRSLGLGTPKEVKPMDEVAAIELGADLVGEVCFHLSLQTIRISYDSLQVIAVTVSTCFFLSQTKLTKFHRKYNEF